MAGHFAYRSAYPYASVAKYMALFGFADVGPCWAKGDQTVSHETARRWAGKAQSDKEYAGSMLVSFRRARRAEKLAGE